MRVAEVSGLPDATINHLRDDGITELYPPQVDAVTEGVAEGTNIVASVPTASGKTLIAEIAMLSAIERGGKALYIVPLRALASEKKREFERFEPEVTVGISTGSYESTDDWLAKKDIIVATSEKADSLLRNGASWIDQLTCVVADEVHLVDDGSRGPTLEVTLAKLRKHIPNLQIVALSATIGNADEIADWLDAALVESSWRPIQLKKGVYYGNAVHFDPGDLTDTDANPLEIPRDAGKPAATLVQDTVTNGGSALVFVNSRRSAETEANRLAEVVDPLLGESERDILVDIEQAVRGVGDTEVSRDLGKLVRRGVAYHHAGLASQHRSLIEDAFRDRAVKVICATPTLAAGVNTPSRRVVVRDWRRYDSSYGGMAPLSTLEVHQMFGRAGRPGLDPYGEAMVIASSHDEFEELQDRYIYADPEPVRSKLAAEPALRTHVLATIATGFATTESALLAFFEETLYAAQTHDQLRLEVVVDRVLEYLERNEFISQDGGELRATEIGQTVSRLYLDPMSAAQIIDGLREATEPTALGLLQLICRTPDMYQLYLRSGDRETFTELVYEREPELLGRMPSEFENEWEDWLSALKTAKLLEDWADELDEDRLTNRYDVGPGDVRGKVDTAEWLLYAAGRLATELDLPCVPAIRSTRKRVQHGVRAELLDLVGVREVGRKRARQLYATGIETRVDLREKDKQIILRALNGRRKTAETILRNAGRTNPSMDDLEIDEPARQPIESNDEDEVADQSNLGDFE